MIRKFDRLLLPATSNRLFRLKLNKKFLSTLSHQFKYDSSENRGYPRREPFKKIKYDGKLALDLTEEKNRFPSKNYYKILGLGEQASINDIKRAYYVLAKKFHPDRINKKTLIHPDKFKEISEAYNILSDESKRIEYDRRELLDQGITATNFTPIQRQISSQKYQVSDITRKLSNILKDNTPEGENKPVPALYNTGEVELSLTFLQSIQGTTKDISVKTISPCNLCAGRSNRIGVRKSVKLCKNCQGTGTYPIVTKTFRGQGVCETCRGTKFVSDTDCNACQKRGFITNDVSVAVKIHPGVKTNEVVQIKHPDGKQNINIRVRVKDNDQFKRIGNDIYTEKELSLTEAALGGKFRIRGVYGNVLLNLEPGTDSHSERRLKGQGVKARSGIGDLIVKFIVKMPKALTTKQRSLLTMLQRIEKSTIVDNHDDTF